MLADLGHITTLHMVSAYMGVLIGGVTFTGSLVAFLKLAGRMSSTPKVLPGRHIVNSSLLGGNMLTMGAFLSMGPASPAIAATCLGANTALSFAKGYTTTAAIGGADMRMCSVLLAGNQANWNSCCHYRAERLLRICLGG